ncbi:hypothetical protein CspeluHIS016_0115130 [Cutaneotrichosporon spelunceum]|uniref:Enoyl-CoA hydratase n=1 Tax=Cutaneotrichosporon spelunceum TaxID=1672016 RepID=A0AAD3TR24_9TREE|nr:hypothetical protein CspeluHIS016_0115130 [Cutaneotrichosporon spelunceum]
MSQFTTPPPLIEDDIVQLSYPAEHILQIKMNRPKAFNAMNNALNAALEDVLNWFESEPTLWVAVLGSTNAKAWCAGMDLKQVNLGAKTMWTRNGFGGMTQRFTRKPLIGAIRGYVLGGGSEMVMNLDISVAGEGATFGFPEVKRGVVILAGGLERLVKLVGHQRACELALTGRNISPQEAKSLGMINYVVPDDQVDAKALEIAKTIASNSPDSVMATLYGIRITDEAGSARSAHRLFVDSAPIKQVHSGENTIIGVRAFAEKKQPKWVASKL